MTEFAKRGEDLLKQVNELEKNMTSNMSNSKYDTYEIRLKGLEQGLISIQRDFGRYANSVGIKNLSKNTKVSNMNNKLSGKSSSDQVSSRLNRIAGGLERLSNKLS
jgi:hypothetical protein